MWFEYKTKKNIYFQSISRMDHGSNHRRYLLKNEWHCLSFKFFKIKQKNQYKI